MRLLFKNIWKRNDKLPLDHQIFNETCFLLIIVATIGFGLTFFIQQSVLVSILFLDIITVGIALLWLSNFMNFYKTAKLILAVLLYAFSILSWFYNGGIEGSTILMFLAINIYLIGLYPKKYFLLLSINITTFIVLSLLSYYTPLLIHFSYVSEVAHVFDITTSYVIITTSIVLVLRTILKNFNRSLEINIVQKLAQELLNNDLKKSKFKVEEREAYLNSIINNREEAIWSIDTDYNFNIFNNYYKNLYLTNYKIKLEKGYNALNNIEGDILEFWKSKYVKVFSGERVVFEYKNPDSLEPQYFKISLNPIISNHQIIGVSGLAINITEHYNTEKALTKSKDELKTILKTIPDYIFHFNKKGVFINFYQENKAQKLLETPSEFINKSIYSIFEKDLALKIQNKIEEALKNGTSEVEYSLQMDELRHFEAKMSYLNKNEVIASVRDITERKNVNQALKENENQLKELNNSKDKLFSIIAHDLRSPFNSILGFSDLLINNTYESNATKKYISIINSSAKNTLTLLDNLLNWAKSQSGKITYTPEKINLSLFMSEIIATLITNAKFKNISLNHTIASKIEVNTDVELLKTVVRNLITNAIKFTKSGGNIQISAILHQKYIEISITDNGVGMCKEKCEHIFNTSTNTSSRGTANEKGSGLGLILCKEFVEKLKGTIWVESIEEKGSTFKFTLPM